MYRHSVEVLEFPKILERLASYASTPIGQELAQRLCPSRRERAVEKRQRETSEARHLLESGMSISLGGEVDVRPYLKKARVGAVLLPQELLEIHNALLVSRSLGHTILSAAKSYPLLAQRAEILLQGPSPSDLGIGKAIRERGEVVDGASPALTRIRRELRTAQARLEKKLEEIVSSPETRPYLQEPLVTQRSGRYVVPVRADFKGRIPGLVHDRSTSGATVFIEPLATVELNNRLRELELEEEAEVQRILKELTQRIAEHFVPLWRMAYALGRIDLALAKAKYSIEIQGTEPRLVPLRKVDSHPGSALRLIQARHPLLDPGQAVPIDVYFTDDYFILVITGPNTGGKTVTLKTVGLLALMAQVGMHIPAAEALLSVFDGVWADIGVEQSIEQNLSTFSSHLTNIIAILKQATGRDLVLLDELGAGTDPQEGSALALALTEHLRKREITTLIATHYSALKVYAQVTPGVENASLEFDPQTLAPTYHLTVGLPGRSHALAIARRLGLALEIVEEAQAHPSPQDQETEKYLEEIQEARRAAQEARVLAQEAKARAEALEGRCQERIASLEKERAEILNQARRQAQEELAAFRQTLKELRKKPAAKIIKDTLEQLEKSVEPLPSPKRRMNLLPGQARVGDPVWVRGLGQAGEIVEVLGPEEVEVQVGSFRIKARVQELEPGERKQPASATVKMLVAEGPIPRVLRLRGMKAEEALVLLEKYLDDAFLARWREVRILHGRGTGTLRRLVREKLAEHPLVASFRHGDPQEGGEGVTVVELVERE